MSRVQSFDEAMCPINLHGERCFTNSWTYHQIEIGVRPPAERLIRT